MDFTPETSRIRKTPVNAKKWEATNWDTFVNELASQDVTIECSKAKCAVFITDGGGLAHGLPSGVLRAQSALQISKLLKAAQKYKVPITVRGGGLTTDGESVAYGGVLLDMTGMSRVKQVDAQNLTVRTEAGIFWHSLAEELRRYGLDYQSAPLNFTSSVGGTLGVGGVDINSPVRGCSADQALAVQVVTPTGDILECSETENRDLFNKVILGYGQFGVITEATLKIRKFTPLRMNYYFYSDMRTAIEDMQNLVFAQAADYYGILTINDKAINLLVAFDSDEAEENFKKNHIKLVRGHSEMIFALRMAVHYLTHPWKLKEALFLFKRKQALFPEFHRPEFMDGNKIHDRTVVYSRAVWKFWGGKIVVIPDIASNTESFADAVIEGVKVCKKHFPYFTMYCVGIKLQDHSPERYELSCIPPNAKNFAWGCEFEPMILDKVYSRDQFQSFKNEIYDVGIKHQSSFYRFGGGMKAYIPKVFGEKMMQKHFDEKLKMDPAFILNPEVIF